LCYNSVVDILTSQQITILVRERFSEMSEKDQRTLKRLARQLIRGIKRKYAEQHGEEDLKNFKFGPDAALEILYMLGAAMKNGTLRIKK
jgi:hypothetical protein